MHTTPLTSLAVITFDRLANHLLGSKMTHLDALSQESDGVGSTIRPFYTQI